MGLQLTDTHNIVKEPSSRVVIRFQDCDPFGHLNNGRYIDYFINAREDHLADYYGLDIYERQKRLNENWVITKHEIAYFSPAVFREEVVVNTCLVGFTDNSLHMEGVMLDKNAKLLKSVIWTQFRYFSLKTGKPLPHPPDLMELFGAMVVDAGAGSNGFDSRVKALRSKLH